MKTITFAIPHLQAMPRPAEYLSELQAAAIRHDAHSMTFNLGDPKYQAIQNKYRVKGQVTGIAARSPAATNHKTGTPVADPKDQSSWPVLARVAAKMAKPEDKGVGDTVQRLAALVGGEQFKALVPNCGCSDRQKWLNEKYPY